mgnify:CR=1 FL=1
MGRGAMTGRAAGYCAGFGMPGYLNARFGRGPGAGFGFGRGAAGRGWRYRFAATAGYGWRSFGSDEAPFRGFDPERERQALRNEASALETELDRVRRRLDELEKENP